MKLKNLALGVTLMAALPAYAHSPKGPNGGRLVDAEPYHAELIAKEKTIEIFLSDENEKPIDPGAFKGVAIFKLGGKAERITLVPSGKGALTGQATAVLPPDPKGAVQFTAPDGKTTTARFD